MREINPFGLRMPTGLREEIARSAKRNQRSMNSEIVRRLEDSFSNESTKSILYAIRMLPTQIENALKEVHKP